MSGAVDKVAGDVAQARASIGEALKFVASINDAADASEAYDRVKLLKEWARIKKLHNDMHRDLLRLEIHCLRKIAKLGPVNVVPAQYRSAASFFKDKSDKDIEELIKNYGQRVTPVGLVKRALADQEFRDGYEHVVTGDYRGAQLEYSHEVVAEAVERYAIDAKAALASILSDYNESGDEFSVHDLASDVFNKMGVDDRTYNWGVEAAMVDVCRKAISEAPDLRIGGTKAPKFVTCMSRTGPTEVHQFIRVPFHAASIDQLRDMVALRLKQKHAAIRAHEELDDLLESLESQLLESDGTYQQPTLGELAIRLAVAGGPSNVEAGKAWEAVLGRKRRAS